jgi:hypothetical protein
MRDACFVTFRNSTPGITIRVDAIAASSHLPERGANSGAEAELGLVDW